MDNLIGLSSADPYSQPTHRRSLSTASSSPSTSIYVLPPAAPRPTNGMPIPSANGVPIPRPSSRIHRPTQTPSEVDTPLSHSPSSDSQFPFSPVTSTNSASYISNNTGVTTPPSSASLNSNPPAAYPGTSAHTLSYPSVPPPSLSSSFGSPNVAYHIPHRDSSISPAEPVGRRSTHRRGSFERRVPDPNYRSFSQNHSRRESVERGARVAETGTLIPRSRAGSQSLASTTEDPGYMREIGQSMDGIGVSKI